MVDYVLEMNHLTKEKPKRVAPAGSGLKPLKPLKILKALKMLKKPQKTMQ
jgi:hypothetical protein